MALLNYVLQWFNESEETSGLIIVQLKVLLNISIDMILRFIFGSDICLNSDKNGHAPNTNMPQFLRREKKRGEMEKKGKGRAGQGRTRQGKVE